MKYFKYIIFFKEKILYLLERKDIIILNEMNMEEIARMLIKYLNY